MNSPNTLPQNASERNIRYQTTGYEIKDLGCATPRPVKSWVRTLKPLDAEADLTLGERSVYATINRVVQFRKGEISMPDLALYSSRSERQAYRDILSLRKKGRIGFASGGGRSKTNRYWLTHEYAGPRAPAQNPDNHVSEMRRNPDTPWQGLPIKNARASGQEKPEERETTTTAAPVVALPGKTKTQAEKGEPVLSQESQLSSAGSGQSTDLSQTESAAVVETLTYLGVARPVAIDDARRAPAEAVAVLAIVLGIVKRGGIRNPPGLARAALRDPARYLPLPRPAPPPPLCWHCKQPLDARDGSVHGMHFDCYDARAARTSSTG